MPHVLGALRLLAASYAPSELNSNGFALYADFRPKVKEWGERGRLSCERILGQRKRHAGSAAEGTAVPNVKMERGGEGDGQVQDRESKRPKMEAKDEYDAALEDDWISFEDLDALAVP